MKLAQRTTFLIAFVAVLSLGGCGGGEEEVTLNAVQKQAMLERLVPDGQLAIAGELVPLESDSGGDSRSGEDIYNSKCTTCHTSGAAGAPILGKAGDWTERVSKGIDVLYANAISGFKGMPPKGLCFDCSDEELKASVDYMIDNSK